MAAKGGAKTQAIGPSRGGQTTKIHVLTDVLGRPAVIRLTRRHHRFLDLNESGP